MNLKNIKTPLILKQTERLGFRDPAACYHEGTVYLYFTMVHQEEREQYFSIGMCRSTDLIHWSEPAELTGKDRKEECFGPGNLFFHAGSWYLCMQTRRRKTGERTEERAGRNGRICIMRTNDLEHFEEPVPLEITGEDAFPEETADRSDPYLFRDKDDPEIIWCLYRKNGKSHLARSQDLKKWTYAGSVPCEENACVIVKDGVYRIFHSPENGIGQLMSADLRHYETAAPDTYLAQCSCPWARDRISAGFALDGSGIPGIGGYLLFYQGEDERDGAFPSGAGIGMAYTSDLEHYVTFEEERPTYPWLGRVYPGDYYEELPFEEYIDGNQKGPEPMDDRVFDIRRFGAAPVPGRVNTAAVQAAADACRKAGGGTILVTGGEYLSGTVRLYDNTTLHITPDACLKATRESGRMYGAFLTADNAENITITGGGVIHGNGEWFVYEPKLKPRLTPMEVTRLAERGTPDDRLPYDSLRYNYRRRIRFSVDKYREGMGNTCRPGCLIELKGCRNITVRNVILRDSMSWTLNLHTCDRALVEDMVIDNNRHVANTDGIDITGSSHIVVRHCFISTADDGIVVKNPRETGRSMEEIRIRDCGVVTVMNAFKIGTETAWDISHVSVEDCRFFMPDLYPGSAGGISVESADGSRIRDVNIRNVTMDRVTCPIFICLNCRNRYGFPAETETDRGWGGSIENVRIEKVLARDAEVPSLIFGFSCDTPEGKTIRRPVRDITVEDLRVTYRDNHAVLHVPEKIGEYLKEYPENNTFGDVDACGVWVRHGDNIRLAEIEITPRTEETREKIRMYDVR